jgi:hypothetical protein
VTDYAGRAWRCRCVRMGSLFQPIVLNVDKFIHGKVQCPGFANQCGQSVRVECRRSRQDPQGDAIGSSDQRIPVVVFVQFDDVVTAVERSEERYLTDWLAKIHVSGGICMEELAISACCGIRLDCPWPPQGNLTLTYGDYSAIVGSTVYLPWPASLKTSCRVMGCP